MASIVTRQTEGGGATVNNAPLTNTQLDTNFININLDLADKISTTGSYSDPSWITTLSETKVLPTQTGNSGKYLTTDGSITSWSPVSLPSGQTAGSSVAGYLQYNGTTKTDGQLYGGTTAPSNVTRLNFDGHLYATKFFGDGSSLTGVSGGGATITDDTTTNATHYLLFDDITTGSASSVGVSSTKLYYNPSTGTLNATNFNTLSDLALKTNITPIINSLDILKKLNPVSFDWKDNGNHSHGLIAQELQKVLPELVSGTDQKSVNYIAIIAILIKAIQDLDNKLSK